MMMSCDIVMISYKYNSYLMNREGNPCSFLYLIFLRQEYCIHIEAPRIKSTAEKLKSAIRNYIPGELITYGKLKENGHI